MGSSDNRQLTFALGCQLKKGPDCPLFSSTKTRSTLFVRQYHQMYAYMDNLSSRPERLSGKFP